MSFDPSLPDEGANVSRSHPVREVLVLLAGVLAVGVLFVVVIGAAVDLVVPRLPPALEVKLFSAPWVSRLGSGDSDEPDPRLALVEGLLPRLERHWPGNPYRFRVALWEQEQPNAVAFPGGWIAVTTGLLEKVESENELAFVLAHELGHFRNRDHLRGLGRGLALGLAMAALGGTGAGRAAELAGVAADLADRGFDREQERDADRFGLTLVAAEYGHVAGATDFFERIPERGGITGRVSHYFSTHPLDDERIEDLDRAASEQGWPTEGQTRPFTAH